MTAGQEPGATLCVPTPLELERLRTLRPALFDRARWTAVEVIGFGPVAAAATASALLQGAAPGHRLVLIGIAGRYDGGPAVGEAARFGRFALDGVGAGEGDGFLGPEAMGFPQLDTPGSPVFDRIEPGGAGPPLLTVCAASDGEAMRRRRQGRWPGTQAEDMEAFGVALAAARHGAPLTVLRGISNEAGDRDVRHWRIDDALAAAADLLLT